MLLTKDQQIAVVQAIAANLHAKRITSPSGVTLLNELRVASRQFGVKIPNLHSVDYWFPKMLSNAMDKFQEEGVLDLLGEFEARISAIEKQQEFLILQNEEHLKYLKRIFRKLRDTKKKETVTYYNKESTNGVQKDFDIVVVGVEGGYREHLKNKLKGFPVNLKFKSYREEIHTYGTFDRVVFFAKHGTYYREAKHAWHSSVEHGTGSLTSVYDIIMNFISRKGGV